MSNLAFPQLSSGAAAQYPLRKRRIIQSTINAFADGSTIASNINGTSQHVWELSYKELTAIDQAALENHFIACQGPLQPFIFVDPTGNMLSNSSSLTIGAWIADPLLSVSAGAADPMGGNTAFTLVNSAQVDQQLSQTLIAPANFQYCLSVYASAPTPTTLRLARTAVSSQVETLSIGSGWIRAVSSGRLPDNQIGLTISLVVPAAQTLLIWGPQLEPQLSPSSYRATAYSGGVYQNAHLIGNSLTFECEAPGLFSTLISIETT